MNLLMLTGPIFMLQVYDLVLPSQSLPTLVVLVLFAAFLFIIFGALDFVRARLLSRLGVTIVQRLRSRLVEGVMQLSLATGGAPASMRPLQDLETINSYYSSPAFAFWFDVPGVPFYLAAIFLMHPLLGGWAVLSMVVLLPIALALHRRAQSPLKDAEIAGQKLRSVAENTNAGAASASAMGMTGALQERWLESHDAVLVANLKARDRTATLGAIIRPLRLALQSGMLAIGAWLVIENQVTAGVMVAASIILGWTLQPVDQFIAHLRMRGQYRQARQRIDDFLAKLPEKKPRMVPVNQPDGPLGVSVVRIAPPNRTRPVLVDIRFEVHPGSILAIVGPNGVGKSSLLRTLTGIWPVPPGSGSVTLDHASLDQWPPDELGRHIGFVEQNVALMDGTIWENIARFSLDPREDDVREAARRAGVDKTIREFGGYDLDVGPGGRLLSAGQRQQVALARALYSDPSLIVLDEPFAALDRAAQETLARSLVALREAGKIIVFTDHGGWFQKIADRLLVLGFNPQGIGQQVAFGPVQEVLRQMRASQPGKRQRQGGAGGAARPNDPLHSPPSMSSVTGLHITTGQPNITDTSQAPSHGRVEETEKS